MNSLSVIISSLFLVSINFFLNGGEGVYFAAPVFISSFLLFQLIQQTLKNTTIFHPVPFVSLILLWSMVCSPFVAYGSGYNVALPPKEIDWLTWHVMTSILYTFCVLFFYVGIRKSQFITFSPAYYVKSSYTKIHYIGLSLLLLTFIMQVVVFMKFGGVEGYINVWSSDRDQFKGLGVLLIVAEAFPILFAFYILLNIKTTRKTIIFFILLLITFFLIKLVFGGFRGSRSNTIWGLFWLAGVIHIVFYRFSKVHFIAGTLFLVSFMSLYSIYKTFGVEAFSGDYTLQDTGRYEGSTSLGVLLTDFSRAGEHAFILHEYFNRDDYDVKLGQTYAFSFFKLLPGLNSPFGHADKNSAGAELFYGQSVDPEFSYFYNSRIYGLYGEGLLNFGPFIPVVFFIVIGFLIGIFHNYFSSLSHQDPRCYLIPFVSNLGLMLVLADSDNIVFFAFKNGLLAVIFIGLVSVKVKYHE